MLKLLIPTFLMLFFSMTPSWRCIPPSFFLLIFISPSLYLPFHSLFSTSLFSSVDHLSAPLITLTLWISALTIPISLLSIHLSPLRMSLPLLNTLLALVLISAFSASNLLTFYILFETSLIPTLLMILLWGYQPDRLQASFYMMMYTISASLPLLFSILMFMDETAQLNMFFLTQANPTNISPQLWWFLCIFAFLVKLPLYSLHLWLPKAHVEAPTAGSMILASILLKLGGYGLIRFSNMCQHLLMYSSPLLLSIALIGASLTGLICLRQTDLKALIAYSSVAHMALLLAGLTSLSQWGVVGALMMMLAHGLSSPALFSLAGLTYEMTNTRSLFLTKGLLTILPNMTMWWFIATAMNMAAPPSLNLLAEILLLTAIMSKSLLLAPLVFLSTFLAVAYSLHLYTCTQHGTPPSYLNPSPPPLMTHNTSLFLNLAPLITLILKPELLTI